MLHRRFFCFLQDRCSKLLLFAFSLFKPFLRSIDVSRISVTYNDVNVILQKSYNFISLFKSLGKKIFILCQTWKIWYPCGNQIGNVFSHMSSLYTDVSKIHQTHFQLILMYKFYSLQYFCSCLLSLKKKSQKSFNYQSSFICKIFNTKQLYQILA